MKLATRFTKTNEKDFLLGYLNFTSKIRINMLKVLDTHLRNSKIFKEKQAYYVLALEQLFLLQESYQSFYIAFRDRLKKSFLDTLSDDNTDVQSLYNNLVNKSEKEIIQDLNYSLTGLTKEQNELVQSRLVAIAKMWQDKKFVDAMKTIFLPMFNSIKHKMMIYSKDKRIMFAFEDEKDHSIEEVLKKYGIKAEANISSLSSIIDIAERLNAAIKDLIILRVLELGVQPPIEIYEDWQ